MKLKKIAITNFKGIDELKFKPGKINLIIGRNNSGKTTLLEAIDLLSNTREIKRWYYQNPQEAINIHSQEARINATILGKNKKGKIKELRLKRPDEQIVAIEFKKTLIEKLKTAMEVRSTPETGRIIEDTFNKHMNEKIFSELSKRSIFIIGGGKRRLYSSFRSEEIRECLEPIFTIMTEKINEDYIGRSKKDKKEHMFELLDPYDLFFILESEDIMPPFRVDNQNNIIFIKALVNIPLRGKNAHDAIRIHKIEKYIKKYELVKNLENFKLDFLLFKDRKGLSTVAYNQMGDGFKAIVALLWHLSSEKISDKIVLLEEPENHMHPGYLKQLVKIIIKFSEELNIQFFMTSHNADFIESFFNKNLSQKEKRYLNKELLTLRMGKIEKGDYATLKTYDYKEAKETLNEFFIDLRGV